MKTLMIKQKNRIVIIGVLAAILFFAVSTKADTKVTDVNEIKAPEIIAKHAVVYDVNNKEFIYTKDAETPAPMASLVKIITLSVFLKINNEFNGVKKIQIIKDGIDYNQGDKQLVNKEEWRVENLIRYTLMTSSNVAIKSIVASIVDDEDVFLILMNKMVRDLNLKHFTFKSVTGLDYLNLSKNKLETSTYGNAKEIALLFDQIFKDYPFLADSSVIEKAQFVNLSGNIHNVNNINKSLSNINNIIAAKTGTTKEAGGNIFIMTKIGDNKYITVIMGSTEEGRYSDIAKLASSTEVFATLK